ncbi:MAG: mycofactocin biosynthesis glycosyltransferase MftF [Desulfobacteraceae bacterium]
MDFSKQPIKTHDPGLAYRLRPATRFHRLADENIALILLYPLRAVVLDPQWQPALDCLNKTSWARLERIAAAVPRFPVAQVELFYNELVRKGFFEQRGFPLLDDADYPSVSVIVPVRNRPKEITACLAALTALNYPREKLEIIVVDDASDDGTPDAIVRFPQVRLLPMQQHRQASYCRNRAAEMAQGEILAFTDSDCLADAGWLKELVPAFRDRTLGALGGWVDAAGEKNPLDRYEKVKSALKMGTWFRRSDQTEKFFYVPTCNFLVRKDLFARLGGFRESLYVGEDVDFCWRLQDEGFAMEYRPMGRISHKHRNRLGAFCARRFDYGTSETMLQQLHAARVKTLYLPWFESLFWLTVVFSMVLGAPLLLLLGLGIFVADGIKRRGALKSRNIPVTLKEVYTAILRGYLSFVHHCCSFFSRYYLIVVPIVLLLSPLLGAILIAMHATAGMVEFWIKKPRLNPLLFLLFFTLEQASYQAGVWWECIRRANFKPVLPRIIHKRV